MVDAVSAADNWSAISAVIGAGGVSGIVIAVVGYLSAARSGRKGEPEKAAGVIGISALLADAESVTKLSISISQLALAGDKIALLTAESRQDAKELLNDLLDEIRKLRRAVEDKT